MIRDELRRLHKEAGAPTVTNLKEYSDRGGHSVGRSTLAGVLSSTAGLRWATVEAFVDACVRYARSRGRSLSDDLVDLTTWRTRFDREERPANRPAPRRVGVMPRLADHFQTRTLPGGLVLAGAGSTTVLAEPATRLLSGMGGVGKTQLAVHLAEHLWHANELDLLVWIAATSRQAITAGYAQAATDLALRGADSRDIERDAARFLSWLTSTSQRWLIVLDDLTSAADLNRLWPPTQPTGRTVVTTRLRVAALAGPSRRLVPVGAFTAEEAGSYLRRWLADHPGLADDVDGVAADLGHLPLAIAHAAAFMIDEDVHCSEYRRRLTSRLQHLDDLAPAPDQLPDDYDRTVAATVALSVEVADRSRPAGLATPLLQLASLLDPAGIPISIFTATASRTWLAHARATGTPPGDDREREVDASTVRSGLRCLHRLNLVTMDNDVVVVHGLVQRAVREAFADDRQTAHTAGANEILVDRRSDPKREADMPARLIAAAGASLIGLLESSPMESALQQNARALIACGEQSLLLTEAWRLNLILTDGLLAGGWKSQAIEETQQVVQRLEALYGPGDRRILEARRHLARLYSDTDSVELAIAELAELSKTYSKIDGSDSFHAVATRRELYQAMGKQGDPGTAYELMEQLLDEQRSDLEGELRWDHITGRINELQTELAIAVDLGKRGRHLEAIARMRRAIQHSLATETPPDTTGARIWIARWHREAGDFNAALMELTSLIAELPDIEQDPTPNEVGLILAARVQLVALYQSLGDRAQEKRELQNLRSDCAAIGGQAREENMDATHRLAYMYAEDGNLAEALSTFIELSKIAANSLNPDDPRMLTLRWNIARLRVKTGDHEAARNSLRDLIADYKRIYGDENPGSQKFLEELEALPPPS